jgi:plastocyanin
MRAVLGTVTGLAVLAVTSQLGADARAGVAIKNFRYGPPVLNVAAGTAVTWTNQDEEPHTITSATGEFTSAGLSHDETFTQRFTRPGTYAYSCALHPQMRGTVVVR